MENRTYRYYKGVWIWKAAPHTETKLTKPQCKDILSSKGFAVRNTYDFDCKEQTNFWYIIKDSFGGMSELSSNTRNRIRKAQTAFTIRRITKEQMLDEGYRVYLSAWGHYKIKEGCLTEQNFKELMQTPDYEFWGCIFNETGKLEAYAICRQIGNFCQRVSSKANPEYLPKFFPMYGLYYTINEYYLMERQVKYISNGSRSITEHSNIQNFLIEKFNYRKAYCHLQIYYKWWMRIAVFCLLPFRKFIPIHSVKTLLYMHTMQSN